MISVQDGIDSIHKKYNKKNDCKNECSLIDVCYNGFIEVKDFEKALVIASEYLSKENNIDSLKVV